jgi:hypothetical protein
MAADETGVASCHFTLTANTAKKVELTGMRNRSLEIVHHGGTVTDPLFFTMAPTEAALTAAVKFADETLVVVAGERFAVNAPRVGVVARDTVWLSIICNGTAGVSVEAVN